MKHKQEPLQLTKLLRYSIFAHTIHCYQFNLKISDCLLLGLMVLFSIKLCLHYFCKGRCVTCFQHVWTIDPSPPPTSAHLKSQGSQESSPESLQPHYRVFIGNPSQEQAVKAGSTVCVWEMLDEINWLSSNSWIHANALMWVMWWLIWQRDFMRSTLINYPLRNND